MQNCSVKLILVIKLWLIEYRVCYTFFILAIPVIFVFFYDFGMLITFLMCMLIFWILNLLCIYMIASKLKTLINGRLFTPE